MTWRAPSREPALRASPDLGHGVQPGWRGRGRTLQRWNRPSPRLPAHARGLVQRLARMPAVYLWGSAAVLVAHLAFKHPDYLGRHALLAGVIGVLTVNVLLWTVRSARHELPILAWAMLQYYVYWAAPVFYEGKSLRMFPFAVLRDSGAIAESMLGDLAFLFAVLAAFALTSRWAPRRRQRANSAPTSQLLLLVASFVSLAMSYELMWYERTSAPFLYLATSLFSPTLLQLFMVFERQQHPTARWFDVGYVLFVVSAVLVGLMSGRMEHALYPVVVAGLTTLARTRRVPTAYVAAVLVLMVVMQPVKLIYRELTGFRTSYYQRLSPAECLQTLGRSFETGWTGGASESVYQDNVSLLGERLNELTTNAVVHYTVPDVVPFDRGSTMVPMVYAFIPRAVWQDKPVVSEVTNDHFSVRLGFQTPVEVRRTTKTMPVVSESYFSFGWPGIVGIGLFCGALFAALRHLFVPGSRVFYVGVFFVVLKMRPSDGFALVVCDAVKPMVFALCWTILFAGVGHFQRGWFIAERWAARRR